MGKKKLQGADGMNFQLQLTIKGLESINLPEENLTNESGNDIMKISCWGGKLSAYVNLPNAIRPNNVQPFQLSDCIKIELVRNQVIEHMRSYTAPLKAIPYGVYANTIPTWYGMAWGYEQRWQPLYSSGR